VFCGLLAAWSGAVRCPAQPTPGLPEPSLVMYGAVTNGLGNVAVVFSNLTWKVSGGGVVATVNSTIINVNERRFFVVRIPFETVSVTGGGLTLSANTLPLPRFPTDFVRTASVLETNATIVPPKSASFTFGASDRGRIERVDLQVNLPVDPNQDFDGDGMPDWAEAIAGTNPKDPKSVLKLSSDIKPQANGGLVILWSSVPGKSYSVSRSTNLIQQFVVLADSVRADSITTTYFDSTVSGNGPFFYRISVR
jgi:hypothetical protein